LHLLSKLCADIERQFFSAFSVGFNPLWPLKKSDLLFFGESSKYNLKLFLVKKNLKKKNFKKKLKKIFYLFRFKNEADIYFWIRQKKVYFEFLIYSPLWVLCTEKNLIFSKLTIFFTFNPNFHAPSNRHILRNFI